MKKLFFLFILIGSIESFSQSKKSSAFISFSKLKCQTLFKSKSSDFWVQIKNYSDHTRFLFLKGTMFRRNFDAILIKPINENLSHLTVSNTETGFDFNNLNQQRTEIDKLKNIFNYKVTKHKLPLNFLYKLNILANYDSNNLNQEFLLPTELDLWMSPGSLLQIRMKSKFKVVRLSIYRNNNGYYSFGTSLNDLTTTSLFLNSESEPAGRIPIEYQVSLGEKEKEQMLRMNNSNEAVYSLQNVLTQIRSVLAISDSNNIYKRFLGSSLYQSEIDFWNSIFPQIPLNSSNEVFLSSLTKYRKVQNDLLHGWYYDSNIRINEQELEWILALQYLSQNNLKIVYSSISGFWIPYLIKSDSLLNPEVLPTQFLNNLNFKTLQDSVYNLVKSIPK